MLQQEAMIERVRALCHADARLVAALMYGSFAQGEGDGFSDIEFVLYFEDEALEGVDQEAWVARIAPVELYFVNEYGNGTAIFENLVRGEFHFDRASDLGKVDESWKETDWLPSLSTALVLDRTGELTRRLRKVVGPTLERGTPEEVCSLSYRFVNWILFGSNLLLRGELARSLDLLSLVRDQLLRMARVLEGSTEHWFNPSKLLEKDLSRASYARYAACVARPENDDLARAYSSAWEWGREMMAELVARQDVALPERLLERLDARFAGVHWSPRAAGQ